MSNRKVRAKFQVNEIIDRRHDQEVKLSAIQEEEGDNADFTDATPMGDISITISKTSKQPVKALDFFKAGKTYNVDFEEAED